MAIACTVAIASRAAAAVADGEKSTCVLLGGKAWITVNVHLGQIVKTLKQYKGRQRPRNVTRDIAFVGFGV